jgi:hypothetical protein
MSRSFTSGCIADTICPRIRSQNDAAGEPVLITFFSLHAVVVSQSSYTDGLLMPRIALLRYVFLALALATVGVLVLPQAGRAQHDGEDVNVHNKTGHEVVVFLFDDDHVHLNEEGGSQIAQLKDGESAVAHVPHRKFSILLVDDEDIWHAEFHDCHSTDMTFTANNGHAKKSRD